MGTDTTPAWVSVCCSLRDLKCDELQRKVLHLELQLWQEELFPCPWDLAVIFESFVTGNASWWEDMLSSNQKWKEDKQRLMAAIMFQCRLAWNILPVWTALYETPGHEAVINLQESFTLHPCPRNMMGVIFLLNAEQKNFIIINSIFGKCMQECRKDYWSYKSSLVMKSEDINNVLCLL